MEHLLSTTFSTIITKMNDDVLDLFCEHPDCEDATVEELAAHFEVTVDYYMMEFM